MFSSFTPSQCSSVYSGGSDNSGIDDQLLDSAVMPWRSHRPSSVLSDSTGTSRPPRRSLSSSVLDNDIPDDELSSFLEHFVTRVPPPAFF